MEGVKNARVTQITYKDISPKTEMRNDVTLLRENEPDTQVYAV